MLNNNKTHDTSHGAAQTDATQVEKTLFFRKVEHLLKPNFCVLNIGANNGVENDPVYPLIRRFPHWRGIFVEPDPYNFRALRENLRSFSNVTLVNAAIAATSGKRKFFSVDERSGCDMRIVSQISSFSREYVERVLQGLRDIPSIPDDTVTDDAEDYIIEHSGIECLSIADLLEETSVDHVDFLNIDTEGADFEIFSTIDFNKIRPAILCIEVSAFSSEQLEIFSDAMKRYNYRFTMVFGTFSRVYIQRATRYRRTIGRIKRALGLRPGHKLAQTTT